MRSRVAAIGAVVLVIAAMFVIFNNDDKANSAENAAWYIHALGERDIQGAKEHVCEVRKPDIDRIVASLNTDFDGEDATLTIDTNTIRCTDESDYVTCTYDMIASVFGEVTTETIEESYKTRDGLVCGLVAHDDEELQAE
ncbi:MAG: hypothetical protein L0154_06410 [Chloroflexi bacterium]|nr:hypothetical protein [Chloroflexota bacterium]